MSAPQLLITPPNDPVKGPKKSTPLPDLGWTLLGWVGLVFLTIGLLDLALGWFPTHFGNPEWEFGTVGRTFDSLPITVLGLALVLGAAVARGTAWAVRATALVALLLATILLVGLLVYALDLPLAFRTVTNPAARTGLKRAVLKALVQGTLYPTVLAAVAIRGIRTTLRARPRLS